MYRESIRERRSGGLGTGSRRRNGGRGSGALTLTARRPYAREHESSPRHCARKGQIEVQAVSWPLVKKYAERDAGLPGHKVVVQNAADQSVVAEKTTDASGILVFNVPAGKYLVLGVGDQPEEIAVESGQTVKLKLVVH